MVEGAPRRHGGKGRTTRPAGGLPGWLPADLAAAVPSGGRAFFVACQPCLWFALSPPSPRPPSPPGKGEIFSFLMQGAKPLASPGLEGCGTGVAGGKRVVAGGLLFWLPAAPPLAYFAAPLPRRGRISPRPALAERSSPAGKGEIFSLLMQGASPLASPGLNPRFAAKRQEAVPCE